MWDFPFADWPLKRESLFADRFATLPAMGTRQAFLDLLAGSGAGDHRGDPAPGSRHP